jgi:hypothetical protein
MSDDDTMPADDTHDDPDLEHAAPVVVAVHADCGEAEVTRAHLAASGIDAQVIDEVGGGTAPVDGEPGVAVAVPALQADDARAVLAAG